MSPEEKKELKRLYDIEYRKKNKEKINKSKRVWAKNNPDKVKEARVRNKETKKRCDKEYAKNNKEKVLKNKKKWKLANPEKNKQSQLNYVKKKLKSDPFYKMKHNIRTTINSNLRKNGYSKKSRTYQILGCTFEEFKIYLESKFEPWMNWENRGNWNGLPNSINTAWDIDHIIPLSSATTEEDLIRLNHYSNLQPLCSYTNRWIKSNNYNISEEEHE